jgi:Glycosyltransferases involved in cell wall biogenesis
MSNSLVIIPTYNEKENIERITRKVFSLDKDFDILVVDDGSPDGTGAIVEALQQEYPNRLFLIERQGKLGLGTAYIAGFNYALNHGYDYIFEMDADFSHNPDDLIRLYRTCFEGDADIAIGSRYLTGMNVVNWPLGRILISYSASLYTRIITGMNIKDPTAGFVCYRRRVLETIELDKIQFKGYAFQIEMKYMGYKSGFTLTEVPIVFTNREEGTSKMSGGIFGEGMYGVLRLKWESFFRKYPQKNDKHDAD